jgi:hypothetical protein
MAGEVKSQGSALYFVDRTGTPALVKLTCPTALPGITSGAADRIDTTCLDETDTRTSVPGLRSPETLSVPFVFKPADASHKLLFTLKETGEELNWIAVASETGTAPTLAAGPTPPAGTLVAPTDRTSFTFDGYISDVSVGADENNVWRGTLIIQRTTPAVPHWVV